MNNSLVLGLALTAAALHQGRELKNTPRQPSRSTSGKRVSDIVVKDFLISNIYSQSFFESTEKAWNRTVSCQLSHFLVSPASNMTLTSGSPLHRP